MYRYKIPLETFDALVKLRILGHPTPQHWVCGVVGEQENSCILQWYRVPLKFISFNLPQFSSDFRFYTFYFFS